MDRLCVIAKPNDEKKREVILMKPVDEKTSQSNTTQSNTSSSSSSSAQATATPTGPSPTPSSSSSSPGGGGAKPNTPSATSSQVRNKER